MNLLQISLTHGKDCGIAIFAETLANHLRTVGISVITSEYTFSNDHVDLVLFQHHDELISDRKFIALAASCSAPLVLFAHSANADRLASSVQGMVAMCPGMLGVEDSGVPTYVFPHPAWTPQHFESRSKLRREFCLPTDRQIIATSGFLKFERQLLEISSALVVEADRKGWFIDLITSPWRLESTGLLEALNGLVEHYPNSVRVDHAFLERTQLNRQLQACDLLWCWTNAPSSPYASGVVSDHYASGTRMFVANKQQHGHVLGLPNVVTGPGQLDLFIDGLIDEMERGVNDRHNPEPVSWRTHIDGLANFLAVIADSNAPKCV